MLQKLLSILLFLFIVSTSIIKAQDINKTNQIVIVFSPNCPICLKNIVILNEIYNQYAHIDSLQFLMIIPSSVHISSNEIKRFKKRYHIKYEMIVYDDYIRKINATITPEAFLIRKTGEILYQGLITNKFVQIGEVYLGEEINYLELSIKSFLYHQELVIKKTNAVGCFIEINNN